MRKTVFITGASSGFGKSCAEKFGKNGWKLVLAARRMDRLEEMKRRLEKDTPVHIVLLDVRNKHQVNTVMDSLPENFRDIDVLLNNAGLALGLEPCHKTDLDDWETMVDTNIKGLLYCTRALLPGMVERNRGHIFNIGSIAGDFPYPGGNVYGATKAFVKQLSRNLRADLLGTSIRVTNIEPGLAETEFSIVRFKGNEEKANQIYSGTKPIRPGDIAEIIFFIAGLPDHLNVNRIEIMPVCQAWGPLPVSKTE